MTTSTQLDFQPLWRYLDNLSAKQIPSDLTEIDATWVYYTLQESDDPAVEALMGYVGRRELELLAMDLRDVCHTAMCEQMEWDRHGRYDYD
jgi:hypothetical protein